jgi:hypothetical protein
LMELNLRDILKRIHGLQIDTVAVSFCMIV